MDQPRQTPPLTIAQAKARLLQWDAQPWVAPTVSSPLARLGLVAGAGVVVGTLIRHRSIPLQLLRVATNPTLLSAAVPFVLKAINNRK